MPLIPAMPRSPAAAAGGDAAPRSPAAADQSSAEARLQVRDLMPASATPQIAGSSLFVHIQNEPTHASTEAHMCCSRLHKVTFIHPDEFHGGPMRARLQNPAA